MRRVPTFFETFPVILIDREGVSQADIPFRRSESRYSIEQKNILVWFSGGVLNGTGFRSPILVKSYARKSSFGEVFVFDKKICRADGVFRTAIRGWFTFSHVVFAFLVLFGQLWHSSRAVFKEV